MIITPIVDIDKKELREEYQAMLDRYDAILSANPDTVTLPQLARAVQDLALYQRRITKIIERMI